MKCPKCHGLGGYPKCPTCQNKLAVNDEADDQLAPATTCSASFDTPETDTLRQKLWGKRWSDSYMTMMTHANKLERERNGALSLIAAIRETASAPMAHPGPWDFSAKNAIALAPAGGKTPTTKKMYKYEKLQQAADSGLLSRDLLSVFIRDHKAGALGNTLANCGIITWEVKAEEYEDASEWWKSERALVINWDQILTICDAYSDDPPPKWRNFGSAKRVKLQEYFGIAAMKRPRSKRPRSKRPICPHCGQQYSPENAIVVAPATLEP